MALKVHGHAERSDDINRDHADSSQHTREISWLILGSEDGRAANTTGGSHGDHNGRHNTLLLRSWGLTLAVCERAGNVGLGTEDSEEHAKVLNVRGSLNEQEDEETGDRHKPLKYQDGPANAVLVGDPGHDQGADDGEDVWWGTEKLGLGVVKSELLHQDDGLEEGEGVDGGGGDKVLQRVDEELPVETHHECLLHGWVDNSLLGLVDAHTAECNVTLTIAEPFGVLGEITEREDGEDASPDGNGSFDDEDPAPSAGVHAALWSDADERQEVGEDWSEARGEEGAHVEEGDAAGGLPLAVPGADDKDGTREQSSLKYA